MKVRKARPEDLPELERLRLAMEYPESLFWDEKSWFQLALDRLRQYFPRAEELPDWHLLVLADGEKLSGYLLFLVDDEHGVTHELQGLVLDYAVFSFEGLSLLIARARKIVAAFENEYLLAELAAADKRMQLWFYRCGFRAEQTRVAKRIPRGYQGVSSPAYRIRRARPDNLAFLLQTHKAYSHFYRPAGRDTDLESIEFRYQTLYLGLDLEGSTNCSYFIMEEVSSGLSAGYLFLKNGPLFNGEKSLYVYDVAIAPAFSGRALSLYLKGATETLAGQEGGLVYGDGTLATPVLASWHAQMGYAIDSVRFALDCRPPHVKRM